MPPNSLTFLSNFNHAVYPLLSTNCSPKYHVSRNPMVRQTNSNSCRPRAFHCKKWYNGPQKARPCFTDPNVYRVLVRNIWIYRTVVTTHVVKQAPSPNQSFLSDTFQRLKATTWKKKMTKFSNQHSDVYTVSCNSRLWMDPSFSFLKKNVQLPWSLRTTKDSRIYFFNMLHCFVVILWYQQTIPYWEFAPDMVCKRT